MADIKRTSAEFSRPANTTAYTAKDVVGNGSVGTLAIGPSTSGYPDKFIAGGVITKFRLMANDKNITARFRLHLFHTSPTATADNAPYALLWANRNKRLGYIDFPAMSTEDTTSDSAMTVLANQAFSVQLNNSTNLYYVLETLDAFTPASGTTFYLEIESTLPA